MTTQDLFAKEEILELQLKIIQLQRQKLSFVQEENYEKATSIRSEVLKTETLLRNKVEKVRDFFR